ncbi:MAG: hypothetical protein KatS3mg072_2139 [Meiothermus sp.]|nr:MAG: hypothetical protein KatS3mg072_2139 [Meiothermus sp.]
MSPSFTVESGVMVEKVEALIAQTWQLLVNHEDDLEYQHTVRKLGLEIEQQARNLGSERAFAMSQLILGVSALDRHQPDEAVQRLTTALTRFRWQSDVHHEWYSLAAIAQAWYLLDDYDQMHETLVGAKDLSQPSTQDKVRWLDRLGMIR